MICIAKRADWISIRAEYIGGDISQRALADKYGVTPAALMKRASREGWMKDHNTAYEMAAEKSREKLAEAVSNNADIAARIKEKLLRRLEAEIDALPPELGSETRRIIRDGGKHGGSGKEIVKSYKLRDLTAAYRDLTEDLPKNIVISTPNADVIDRVEKTLFGCVEP